MPVVTLLDLEKVNKMMNQTSNNFTDVVPNNMNYLLTNNINKNNLFANALLQQFQNQQINNKLLSNNLLLNCLQANPQLLNIHSNENQKQINYSRYKTELCRQFIENGECKYGDKCQFAHGMPDLKDVNRHPKYKTDYCKTFHSKGFCPYGPRCHFIHELHEKYDPSIQNVSLAKKTKEAPKATEDNLIDKQLEAIQAHLTSSLFVSDETNENFTVNDSKSQLIKSECEKQVVIDSSNSPLSSGTSSPVMSTSSSNSASSYTSSTSSASVSSSTSPVNRVLKKFMQNNSNKNNVAFDQESQEEKLSTSPLSTPRIRSAFSSTSSAYLCEEIQNCKPEIFSPEQKTFNSQTLSKDFGPIGRPGAQSPIVQKFQNNTYAMENNVNNLLFQRSNNKLNHCVANTNKSINYISYSQFNQNQCDRQSSW